MRVRDSVRQSGACAILVAVGALLASSALAQEAPQSELTSRLVNLPTYLTVGSSTLQLTFTHRFSQTVSDGGGQNLYGLDSAADIGIGLELGLGKRFQAELYRSSYFKELEGAVKWTVFRQGEAFPLGVGVRAGADYRGALLVEKRWSGFAEVVVARRFGEVLDVFVVPMFASDTPTLTKAFNVGVGASLHLPHKVDIDVEVIPRNRDARGGETAWSVGVNKRLAGHAFLLYLGNSRATTTDLLVGSDIQGGFKKGDVRLGFNLLRRFPE